MYLALKRCKNDCKIFKITLVQIFVHENLKFLHLLSDFVLIILLTFDTWNSGDIYLVLSLDKYHNT